MFVRNVEHSRVSICGHTYPQKFNSLQYMYTKKWYLCAICFVGPCLSDLMLNVCRKKETEVVERIRKNDGENNSKDAVMDDNL